MSYITLTSDNGLTLTLLQGDSPPTIAGGYGGWETVDRPKRIGMTRFKGRDPFTQDISVMFDGFSTDTSQEPEIAVLEAMALSPTALKEPPKIRLSNMALKQNLTWVISQIDWDAQLTVWEQVNGTYARVRQAATVHLLEFIDDNVLSTQTSPAIQANNNPTKKKITLPQGMSMKQIAMIVYKDPDKYIYILWANPELNPDPRAIIPPGTPVFIPSVDGSIPKTIIVK